MNLSEVNTNTRLLKMNGFLFVAFGLVASASCHPSNPNLVKTPLQPSENRLTKEQLADGAELIHLNGTQAHISSATLLSDGSVETRCHLSFQSLVSSSTSTRTPLPTPIK